MAKNTITNKKIHKRTFEGKNDNVITSEYGKSYKYVVTYEINGCEAYRTFRTKKEALSFMEHEL